MRMGMKACIEQMHVCCFNGIGLEREKKTEQKKKQKLFRPRKKNKVKLETQN